jgi:hypothetical protein
MSWCIFSAGQCTSTRTRKRNITWTDCSQWITSRGTGPKVTKYDYLNIKSTITISLSWNSNLQSWRQFVLVHFFTALISFNILLLHPAPYTLFHHTQCGKSKFTITLNCLPLALWPWFSSKLYLQKVQCKWQIRNAVILKAAEWRRGLGADGGVHMLACNPTATTQSTQQYVMTTFCCVVTTDNLSFTFGRKP